MFEGRGIIPACAYANIVVVIIDLNVLGFVEMYVYVIVVVQQRVRSCKLTLIKDYYCVSQIDPS